MIQLGAIDGATILNVLLAPFAVAVFLLVWFTAHAINVLILLSPWGAVDAALKSLRLSVLGLLGHYAFHAAVGGHPLLAGGDRALVLPGRLGLPADDLWHDLLLGLFTLRRRFEPDAKENKVFAGKGIKEHAAARLREAVAHGGGETAVPLPPVAGAAREAGRAAGAAAGGGTRAVLSGDRGDR